MNAYEAKRLAKIAANRQLMQALDLPTSPKKKSPVKPRGITKISKSRQSLPARASARLAARPELPSYKLPKDFYRPAAESRPQRQGDRLSGRTKKNDEDGLKPVFSNSPSEDLLVEGEADERDLHKDTITQWVVWDPTQLEPTRDENGTFHFHSHPHFLPNKAPWEVMREGAFGGTYWRPYRSLRLSLTISDDWRELPVTWLHGINPAVQLTQEVYDPSVNKFGVKAGQSIEEHEANGWIDHRFDVRGWFQWYCRYFQGRRCEDDDRQISRWANCTGDNGRWRRTLLKKYVQAGIRSVSDEDGDEIDTPSPAIHQTLHQWGFEIRQNILDEYRESVGV